MRGLIELEPLDTVFFGDARGMELNIGGRSLSIPLPWTVSGALLSHYLLRTGKYGDVMRGCENVNGECESEEKGEATVFAFYGPFLHFKDRYWFSPPADLVRDGGKVGLIRFRVGGSGYAQQLPSVYLPLDAEPYGMLVDHEFLNCYANGKITKPRSEDHFDHEERRVGIHIDDSKRVVKTGYTFSCVHRRPRFGLRYAVLIWEKEERDFNFSGILRLGGEGRVAKVSERGLKEVDGRFFWLDNRELEAGNYVKVVLLSPAIYRSGDRDIRAPDHQMLQKLPGRPELLMTVGGRATMVSGWNMRAKRARKMYAAVPPGTVYYFKLNEKVNRLDLTLSFWKLSLFWERGFGSPLVAVGGVV
ncbi:MAG: type III-B CRISPR module-associated protein Cmr3 [Candidatus Korarchaeum sp.]